MRLNCFLRPLSVFIFVSAMILQRGSLAAQIQAEIVLSQDHYLAGEPIKVAVKVTNFSGKTLKLGETQEWLQFAVEGRLVAGKVAQRLFADELLQLCGEDFSA